MLKLQYDKTKEDLPIEVIKNTDKYLQRLQNISWLTPSKNLTRKEIEDQVAVVLKAFDVTSGVDLIKIENKEIWEEATSAQFQKKWLKKWDSKWESLAKIVGEKGLGEAEYLVWVASRNAAWDKAIQNPWIVNWTSAWIGGICGVEVLLEKPGAFHELLKLWEMGVFPVGILKKTKKFTVYVPFSNLEFPNV